MSEQTPNAAWQAQLQSADPAKIQQALTEIGNRGNDPSTLQLLLPLLNHAEAPMRAAAQAALRAVLQRLGERDDLRQRIMQLFITLTGGERGFIALQDGEGLQVAAMLGLDENEVDTPLNRSIADATAKSGEALLTNNVDSDGQLAPAQNIVMFNLRAIIAVPLIADGQVVGTVYSDRRMRKGLFEADQLDAVQGFVEAVAPLLMPDNTGMPSAETAEEMITFEDAEDETLPPPAPPLPQGPRSALEPAAPSIETVRFSAYQPVEVAPMQWQPLVAYVYDVKAAEQVAADADKQLGPQLHAMRQIASDAAAPVREGALITATPHLAGFQFNPPYQAVAFFEDWHRFDFKLRAKDAPQFQAANGRVTFSVEGVIVGDVPLSVYVGAGAGQTKAPQAVAGTFYPKVFCSYSRRDTAIVQRVERAYTALGMTFLRDMVSLKSGEGWYDALHDLIEKADIFQLFWSQHSATSDHVQMEWAHALQLGRETGFIRPVYWQNPLPTVPDQLGSLHFAYAPDLGTS